ncbi:MAG: hypothetical protein PW789_19655 [Edaphobacter sp.]|uniref:hypothetical protein n=1 Tax=Edaphobacter sp. TaxID=1934404 RepID=UPI002385FE31|nr:hypothetical protein [Edaphobacter sp.]MDE1178796.1 hypothetical protein [Edaphobacter sp.]
MSQHPNSIASASAALVASSFGCFTFGLLYLLGDKSKALNKLLSFYVPSGALSGVLVLGTLVWLLSWAILSRRWSTNPPAVGIATSLAILLLLASLLLTFPPFVRLI